DRKQGEADRGEGYPAPLAASQAEAEVALGEHGEEDEAAGDHGLDDGERRERHRADVQDPGDDRHEHADREEPLAPEVDAAAQRMAPRDVGSRAGSAVLAEEADVRG